MVYTYQQLTSITPGVATSDHHHWFLCYQINSKLLIHLLARTLLMYQTIPTQRVTHLLLPVNEPNIPIAIIGPGLSRERGEHSEQTERMAHFLPVLCHFICSVTGASSTAQMLIYQLLRILACRIIRNAVYISKAVCLHSRGYCISPLFTLSHLLAPQAQQGSSQPAI